MGGTSYCSTFLNRCLTVQDVLLQPRGRVRPKLQMLTNKKILEFHPKFKFVLQFSIYIGIIVTNYAFQWFGGCCFFLDPWHKSIAAHMAQENTIMTANMPKNTMWNNALGCHIGEDTFTKLGLIIFIFLFFIFILKIICAKN